MEYRPSLGIMVSKRSSRKKTLSLYQRHHFLNLKLYTFTPADIHWKEQSITGLTLEKGVCKEGSFPFPHIVYNRCFNKKTLTIERIEKVIGRKKCFNNINFFNKWHLYNHLKLSDLKHHIPETFLYHQVNIAEILERYKLLYIKPSYGNKGDSVYRIKVMDHGDIHISLHSLAPRYICRKNENIERQLTLILGQNEYMIQQGIDMSQVDHQYFDIRVLVQKDILGDWTVSAVTCRVAYEQYFNTSMCETIYDAAELLPRLLSPQQMKEIVQALYKLSVKAAQVADAEIGLLGELSVDFVLDDERKLWIIELNGKPQKSMYKDLKSIKQKEQIYSRPLEYAYYLSQLES